MQAREIMERRRSCRDPKQMRTLVESKGRSRARMENAVIEDVGVGGARIRLGIRIRENENLRIYLNRRADPIRMKVVWVQQNGLIHKRGAGRPGQAFLAGCTWSPRTPTRGRGRVTLHLGFGPSKLFLVSSGIGLFGMLLYFLGPLLTLFLS